MLKLKWNKNMRILLPREKNLNPNKSRPMRMSNIQALEVKKLRQKTGAGIMDCKRALQASDNSFEKALDWLKKKGLLAVAKKSGRQAAEGLIDSYIHNGRLGVLLEVNSETDFVARNDHFKIFVKELSLHIATLRPMYIAEQDIPENIRNKEKKICEQQALEKTKKKEVSSRIAEGLYKKWLQEVCLLQQEFVRENAKDKQTVEQVLKELIARVGENVVIRRFVHFSLGETTQNENKKD